jgi:hypothetical protein
MANSATPIGKLMFYPFIKKADIRTATIECRLWVHLQPFVIILAQRLLPGAKRTLDIRLFNRPNLNVCFSQNGQKQPIQKTMYIRRRCIIRVYRLANKRLRYTLTSPFHHRSGSQR